MKKQLSIKTVILFLISVLFLSVIFTGANALFKHSVDRNSAEIADRLNVKEAAIDPNMPFNAFLHGSKYKHTIFESTDYESYRNGTKSDTVEITVDRSQPHGTEANPYVIDSTSLWNTFASKMATAPYGSNMHFVLAADLDFGGVASNFTFCPRFGGYFYGLGHTISNVLIENANEKSIFRWVMNGFISDLNVVNYSYQEVQGNVGGICAASNRSKILNCHTIGTSSRSTATTSQIIVGGVVGGIYGLNTSDPTAAVDPTYVYRCSAKLTVNVSALASADASPIGGIVAQAWHHGFANILDCYSELEVTRLILRIPYIGTVIGLVSETGCDFRAENCAGKSIVRNTQECTWGDIIGSLLSVWQSNSPGGYPLGGFTIKNVYVQMDACKDNSTANSVSPFSTWQEALTRLNGNTLNFSNIKYGTNGTAYSFVQYSTGVRYIDRFNALCTSMSNSSLWAEAQGSSSTLKCTANIWDTSKINNGSYSPKNAPNINKLDISSTGSDQFTVEFKNHKTTGDENIGISAIKYDYGKTGVTLPKPTAPDSNHTFVGWTTDKSGESTPFGTIPTNSYGDITLYAVWDNPNTTATVTVNNSATGDTTPTLEYGTGRITLTAAVTAPGMSGGTTTYRWYKDSGSTPSFTGNNYLLKDVKDSGSYQLEYFVSDGAEPLWRHEQKLSTANNITINKGNPTQLSFALDATTKPYYGMELSELKFNFEAEDGGGTKVPGTAEWRVIYDKIIKGANTHDIVFHPTDKDNYNDNLRFTVNFNSESLTITFILTGVSDTLEAELEYGQNYNLPLLVNMYNAEFIKRIDPSSPQYDPAFNSLSDKTPEFDGVDIVNPTTSDLNKFASDYGNIKTSKSITVTYSDKEYDVVFKYDDGGATADNTIKAKYNQFIAEPTPAPTRTGYAFLGWYVGDGSGTATTTKWDFLSSRVTGNTELVAKWFKATLTLTGITVTANNPTGYDALHTLTNADLTVTAHFDTDAPSVPKLDEVKNLGGTDGYSITYEAGNCLHYNTPSITVTYRYGGVTKTETLTLSVNKLKVDLSGIKFNDKTVVEDGTAKSIDKIAISTLPPEIDASNIVYEYMRGSTVVPESSVIAAGRYTVTARFTCLDDDYEADPLTATLTITRAAGALTVEWSGTVLQFTGKPQYPTATLKDPDGNDVTSAISFHYEGDTTATSVRGGYKVKVVLDETAYSITSGEEITFGISRATLTAPKIDTDRKIVYNGEPIDLKDYLVGFDEDLMKISSMGNETNAGSYVAVITLTNPTDCNWADTSGNTVNIPYVIEKAHLTAIWDANEFVYDGTPFEPKVINLLTLADKDAALIDYDADLTYSGDRSQTQKGSYTITVALNNNTWAKNYVLDGNTDWDYVILPKLGMTVINIVWGETTLTFNDKNQTPSFTVTDNQDPANDITESVKNLLKFTVTDINGKEKSPVYKGEYIITASIDENSNYFIKSGITCPFEITLDENGNGEEPKDNGDSDELSAFLKKWWQPIVSVICLILIIVFLSLTAKYENQRKKANKREQKYRTYSAVGLFGLAATGWNVIAGLFIAAMVLCLIGMIIAKSRCGKAIEAADECQEEYETNKKAQENFAREEAENKRNEEMKMMFMHMMGSGNPQGGMAQQSMGMDADTIRGIVSETVVALLPQMQQALPAPQQVAQNNDELVQLIKNQERLLSKLLDEKTEVKTVIKEVPVMSAPIGATVIQTRSADNTPKPSVTRTPSTRLSIEEAYDKLSKEQKKFFDGLKKYALSKPDSKEKKSKYYLLYGKSSVNPLVKLSIRKNTTVALFKMEDEYFKDIRKNSEGTRINVKESVLTVTDEQAFKTAIEMIDLRVDQIERYKEYAKEQRQLKKQK